MSETCDGNVLVYAANSASDEHDRALAFLRRWIVGPAPRYLFWPVLLSYLRIVTNRSILPNPLDPADAHANVDTLLARPNVRVVGEVAAFWPAYRAVAEPARVRGNLVPDAHLVALMHQHGVGTIWSRDRDFRRFDGIKVRDPFAG